MIQKYHQHLLSYCLNLTGKMNDAEDLAQDTILRVLSLKTDFTDINRPLGYLYTTCRNVWIDNWRKTKKHKSVELFSLNDLGDKEGNVTERFIPSVAPDVLKSLELLELRTRVDMLSRDLSDQESVILRLHLEGLDCKEIGESLNKDPKLVAYELNAVRAKVRYRIQKQLR